MGQGFGQDRVEDGRFGLLTHLFGNDLIYLVQKRTNLLLEDMAPLRPGRSTCGRRYLAGLQSCVTRPWDDAL